MNSLTTKLSMLLVLAAAAAPRLAFANPRLEDPVPPDAIRTIVPIQARSVPIQARIIPINATIRDEEVAESDPSSTEIHLTLGADVLFDFDQATLKPDSAPAMKKVVDAMNKINGGRVSVSVIGHTDAVGADDYNQALSVRRAEAVRAALAPLAGGTANFSVGGFGSKQPIAPNRKSDGSDDPQGRARNRRVEIVVKAAG